MFAWTRRCLMKRKMNDVVTNSFEFGLCDAEVALICIGGRQFHATIADKHTLSKTGIRQSLLRRPLLMDECCDGLSRTFGMSTFIRWPVSRFNVPLPRFHDVSKSLRHASNAMGFMSRFILVCDGDKRPTQQTEDQKKSHQPRL